MDVHLGIANDYGHDKFGITLDETDLKRLCVQYELGDPEKLPVDYASLLLMTEAERYVLVQSPKYGRSVEEVRQLLAENRQHMVTVIQVIAGYTEAEAKKMVGIE